MANQITVISFSMEDALNKAKRFLHTDDVDNIEYDIVENDGSHVKVHCKLKADNLENQLANHDGYFKIFYKDGFAYLIVFAPQGHGKPVYEEEVLNRMKILNIPAVNILYLRDILDRARAMPEKLVAWPGGAEYRAEISVRLSEDKMQAIVNIKPAKRGGSDPTFDDVLFAIKDAGVTYGIELDTISTIVDKKIFNQDKVVANGLRVVQPVAEEIVYRFDTDIRKPYVFDEYGRANLRELNFIQEKKKGDELAFIAKGKPGKNGVNVLGQTVEPDSIDTNCKLKIGENVSISEDGSHLYADIDGYVVLNDGYVSMQNVVHVENVDFSTGNIDYDGAVIVSGTIADGFEVRATGIIQVGYSVGRVNLYSDSDIILKSGINASGDGVVECKGNFYCRYVENSKVKTKGDCFVEEAIMNSHVEVTGNLFMSGRRAELIGGKIIVGGHVKCKQIGSNSGVKTKLSVGIDPAKINTLIEISDKIDIIKDTQGKLQLSLDKIERLLPKLDPEGSDFATETENKNKILRLQYRFADELKELERDYQDGKRILQAENNRYVIVENQICNGVEISFGNIEYNVTTQAINKIMLRYIEEKVIESGFTTESLPEIFNVKG